MELVEEVAFRKVDTRLAKLLVQRGPVIKATHQALADELGSVRVLRISAIADACFSVIADGVSA